MSILIVFLGIVWLAALGGALTTTFEPDISLFKKIVFFYSPFNIITVSVLLIAYLINKNNVRIKKIKKNKRNKFLFEKYKIIDPYGEEIWDD